MVRRHKLTLNPICELCDRTLANEVHRKIAMEDASPATRETRREMVARHRGEGAP